MPRPRGGTAGMYVLTNLDGIWYVLVHRRGNGVSAGQNLLGAPGGIVSGKECFDHTGGYDFTLGSRQAALRELKEESGLSITFTDRVFQLRHDQADHGNTQHINWGIVVAHAVGRLDGPDVDHKWELIQHGMNNVEGLAAGDNYHKWVSIAGLLERDDVFDVCKTPLRCFLQAEQEWVTRFTHQAPTFPEASSSSTGASTPRVARTELGSSSETSCDVLLTLPNTVQTSFDFDPIPVVEPPGKPLDVLRIEAGRLYKKPRFHKKQITPEKNLTSEDHAMLAEGLTRQWAHDRGAPQLLGHCTHFHGAEVIVFEYHNPITPDFLERMRLMPAGFQTQPGSVDIVFHGGYWETGAGLFITGQVKSSTDDKSLGEHEYHNTQGCYTSRCPETACKHYAWASNRFDNNVYYGLSFRCLGRQDAKLKEFFAQKEVVYSENSLIITHVIVAYNRAIAQGSSRVKFMTPSMEFVPENVDPWHPTFFSQTKKKYRRGFRDS